MTATLAGGEDTLPAIAVPQAVSENQRGEVLLTPYSRQLTTGGGKPGQGFLRSVMYERSAHGSAIHPTQKPLGITRTLIQYACPPGGLVIDPYAGSGTTLVAAQQCGRAAVGAEMDEGYAVAAADRLAETQGVLL